MAAGSGSSLCGRIVRALAAGCFLWALTTLPAHAYDYGRGTYGSGAYNVGQLPATTTTLVSDTNPSTVGDSIRLTATVSPSSATGTVTFKDGSTTLGTATLGHASGSLMTSALSAGSHSLTALYAGNLAFSGSLSNTVTQVVNAAASSASTSSESGNAGGEGGRGGHRGNTATMQAQIAAAREAILARYVGNREADGIDKLDIEWYRAPPRGRRYR